jgi:hypothetical protein
MEYVESDVREGSHISLGGKTELELLRNNAHCPNNSPFAVSLSNRSECPSTGSGRTVGCLITQQLYCC